MNRLQQENADLREQLTRERKEALIHKTTWQSRFAINSISPIVYLTYFCYRFESASKQLKHDVVKGGIDILLLYDECPC